MIVIKNKICAVFILLFFSVNCNSSGIAGVEEITIDLEMKARIMGSSLKENLLRNDGKKIMVYLYAEDEKKHAHDYYSCVSGDKLYSVTTAGHYYMYLYDVDADSFFPNRRKIFEGREDTTFNLEGADLMVLSGAKQKKSDVLLVSQRGACSGNDYEAYGFSENNQYLKPYHFVENQKKASSFFGRVRKKDGDNKLYAYRFYNEGITEDVKQMYLFISNNSEAIYVQPLRI